MNLADIVEIAKLIESQARNNLSYQVRNPNRVSFQPPTVQASSTIRAQDRSGGKQIVSSTRDTTRASGSGEARNPNPCRNCAERWFSGHKCKQQRLKSLAVIEEEEEESPLIEELNEPLTEEEGEPEEGFQVMALSAMSDDSQEHSMKMRCYIKNTKVVVLTDSGATCNFISEELVRQMGWPVTQTRSFVVRVGGGRIIKSSGKCVDVPLEVQRIEFILEFYLFDLGDLDLVLGFLWLAGLGDTRANWGDLRLSWQIGRTWVTLYGDPDLSRGQVSLRSMEKVIKYTGVAYLLELASLFESESPEQKNTITPAIQQLMDKY